MANQTAAQMQAEIEALKAQLAAANAKKAGKLTIEYNPPRKAGTKGADDLGCIGGNYIIRGNGRFPITLHLDTADKMFAPEFVEEARKVLANPVHRAECVAMKAARDAAKKAA